MKFDKLMNMFSKISQRFSFRLILHRSLSNERRILEEEERYAAYPQLGRGKLGWKKWMS